MLPYRNHASTSPPPGGDGESVSQDGSVVLGKVSDDVWNAVGRPRNRRALSMIFPGGHVVHAAGALAIRATQSV
jgi:hypothetical protein